MNVVYNMDCMEAMRKMPDKAFDLAVVDPPYGNASDFSGGYTGNALEACLTDTVTRTGGKWAAKFGKKSSRGT